jgi:hypothetical protein
MHRNGANSPGYPYGHVLKSRRKGLMKKSIGVMKKSLVSLYGVMQNLSRN